MSNWQTALWYGFLMNPRVAGDRWQVKVRFDAVVSVSETFWSLVSGGPELIEEIRAAFAGQIVLSNVNERNFISAGGKGGVWLPK